MSKETVKQDVHRYGAEIIHSPSFKKAMLQKHHYRSTVGEHSLRVTASSVRICHALEKLHVRTDKKSVVQGALCHDLGILGRHEKYKNNRICCVQHPKDSVKTARELIPDLDQKTERIIRRHMWPLGGEMPRSREEIIVSTADKYASAKDVVYGIYEMARKTWQQLPGRHNKA